MLCLVVHCWTCSSRSKKHWAFIDTSSGFHHLQPVNSKLHKRSNRCRNQFQNLPLSCASNRANKPFVQSFCCWLCFEYTFQNLLWNQNIPKGKTVQACVCLLCMINYMQDKISKCRQGSPTNMEALKRSIESRHSN